jgi:hypothetical protein
MDQELPQLSTAELRPTCIYLQNLSKTIGRLQQLFILPELHGWQYGLNVNMRGICTQPFTPKNKQESALIDLVTHKLRLGGQYWPLELMSNEELQEVIKQWLIENGYKTQMEKPELETGGKYDKIVAHKFAAALWYMERSFSQIKKSLPADQTSPILLYPHHFDLSLTRFIGDSRHQISVGFSPGDNDIKQPYIYLTSYPDDESLTNYSLPPNAYWNDRGFRGIVLLYEDFRLNPAQGVEHFKRTIA